MITSPYNFVPLSEKVVMPFWAKQVSHDIPFKDAQSGVLKLNITAESPIYVRNGVPRSVNKNDAEAIAFNNINNQYFIPGSSVKGMLRSVMEIMSFGRMKNKVNNHKYSVRDFQNNEIYRKETFAKDINCGYLIFKNGQYLLKDCGKPGRIAQETLSKSFHAHFSSQNKYDREKRPDGWNPNKDYSKSAKYKYDKFEVLLKNEIFSFEREDNGREIYAIGGELVGKIVFTGQPGLNDCREVFDKKSGKYINKCGKHFEFIFFENQSKFQPLSNDEKESEQIIDNFLFAYFEHEKSSQKPDWRDLRRPELFEKGIPIPIFFRKENGKILDMGLSFLYKITYTNSIQDAINTQQSNSNSFDLAETIFGYTEGNSALKGRVHVGHAFANGNVEEFGEKIEVLAGPKASYYPNYIEQSPNNEGKTSSYKTFMDENAKIRGWKRYPIHTGEVKKNPPPIINGKVNDKIGTKFIPLPSGTEFTLEINYHNLRKEELGALISAITFHNTNSLFHSIGSGKPLGYGKISITITKLEEDKKLEMLKAFELFMDFELDHSTPLWFQSVQIKELTAMAQPGADDSRLEYMKMKKKRNESDPLDFVTAKQNKLALQKYSFISKNDVYVNSLISPEELTIIKNSYKKEIEIFETQQDIQILKQNLISKAKQNLENEIDKTKKELIEKLHKKRVEIQMKEIREKEEEEQNKLQENRENKQASSQQKGLDLERFNPADRNALNKLGKSIVDYAKALHLKSENQLKSDVPDGELIQDKDCDLVETMVKQIFMDLKSKKDKSKWLELPLEKNYTYLKFTFWLGQSRAQSLFDELEKHS